MPYAQQCTLCTRKYSTNKTTGKRKGGDDEYCLPRILACGHAFCDRCISNKLLNSSEDTNSSDNYNVTCPFQFCQRKCTLPDGDVKALQIHKYLLGCLSIESTLRSQNASRLLKLLETSPSDLLVPKAAPEKCFNCEQADAEVFCEKCDNTRMCLQCFRDVHNSRVLASHKAKSLGDKNELESSQIKKQMNEKCSEHPDRSRQYFCMDCSVAVCADCGLMGSHSGHSVNHLEVVNKEVIPKLRDTRVLAGKALDLVHQTNKQINTEIGGGCGDALANPSLTKIEDIFLRLFAMLQLKQHEIEETVCRATGNNTHILKTLELKAEQTGKKMKQLAEELDELLSNPVYEKTCDFTLINSLADEMLKLPCHLVVNDLSECSDIKVSIKEELLDGLSDLVSVSAQTSTANRYELKAVTEVSEEDLRWCPTVRSSVVTTNTHPPVEEVFSVNSIQVVSRHSSVDESRYKPSSPSSINSGQMSYKAMSGYDNQPNKAPILDNSSQNFSNNRAPPSMPFFEDTYSGMASFGAPTSPHRYSGPPGVGGSLQQDAFTPEFTGLGYDGYNYTNNPMGRDFVNPALYPQGYGQAPQSRRKHGYSQDARKDFGGQYGNYEMAARQYNQQRVPETQQFGARDFRLADPNFSLSEDFEVYRGGYVPMSPSRQDVVKPKGKKMARGRGRGAPAPILAPPPGSSSQYSNTHTPKKLYMHQPSPITEKTALVQVSHVESPECIYVQHTQRIKSLKNIQSRINDHCSSAAPLNDLHGVKFLFARVNGAWRRGEVTKVLDRTVVVFCCDYGNTEQLKASELRPPAGSLLSLPRMAIKCYLQGIQPADGSDSWSKVCAGQMKDALNHTSAVTLVKLESPLTEADSLPVDLLLRDQYATSQLSMRDYLVFTEQAVWDSPTCPYVPDEKVLNQAFLKPTPIKEGDNLKLFITHVESPHELYAQVVNRWLDDTQPAKPTSAAAELIELDQVMKLMEGKYSVATSQMLYKVFIPKPGDAVAATYEKEWFRAQIIALLPGHVKVKYVDYGNVEIVPVDHIRVLFKEFMNLPAQAVKLSIHGVAPLTDNGQWSKTLCDGLAEMCTEKMCTGRTVTDNSSPEGLQFILTMTDTGENVGNVLVSNGLAKRSVDTVTENDGIECKFTYAESPGELFVQPVHLIEKLTELTAKLSEVMEQSQSAADVADHEWQVNGSCVLKHGGSWVRGLIEEVNTARARCKLRLIDSGHVINKPQSALQPTPDIEIMKIPAMATRTSIAGIIPAGGSKVWGATARDTVKELVEGCDGCKVIPMGEVHDELPCDMLLPEEQPNKIKGLPGKIVYISLKEKLLEIGVALRASPSTDVALQKSKNQLKKPTPDTQGSTKNALVEKLVRDGRGEVNQQISGQSEEMNTMGTTTQANDINPSSQKSADVLKVTPIDDICTNQPVVSDTSLSTGDVEQGSAKPKSFIPLESSLLSLSSGASVNSKKCNFKVSSSNRLLKSPGGTIRSQVTENLPSQSSTAGNPTEQLLHEAANRLSASKNPTQDAVDERDKSSSECSSDLPTPELRMKLDMIVGSHEP